MGFVLDATDPTTPRPGIICDNADCANVVHGEGWVISAGFFPTYVACSDGCIPAIVAQFGDDYGAPRMDRWNPPFRLRDYLNLLTTPGEQSLRI